MKDRVPKISATVRERNGSRFAKRIREQGRLPGVIYGHKMEPVSVSFDTRELVPQIEKGEKVFKLDMPGNTHKDEDQMVLLKELQFDYLGDTIIHADFARVDLNERVKTKVHVRLQGEAIGLKSAGAILMHPTNEIEIECRVADLPDEVVVEISGLGLNELITADKIKLPAADMKLLTDPHSIIAQIIEAKEEVVAEAAVVGADAATPEVIGEKERAEKAAKDGAAPAKPGAAPAKGAAPAAAAKPAAKK